MGTLHPVAENPCFSTGVGMGIHAHPVTEIEALLELIGMLLLIEMFLFLFCIGAEIGILHQ